MTLALDDDRLRQAHRRRLSAAYFAFTGPLPLRVAPADHDAARAVVLKLELARIQAHPLTGSELTRLKSLIAKWRRRAEGKDPRFEVMGTRSGAPNVHQRDRMLRLGWSSKWETIKKYEVTRTRSKERRPPRMCIGCRAIIFEPVRKDQRYCSSLCRGRTFAKRQAAINAHALTPLTSDTNTTE